MAQVSNFHVFQHRSTTAVRQGQQPPPPQQGPTLTWSNYNDAVYQQDDPFDFDPLPPNASFSRPLHTSLFSDSDSDPDLIRFEEEEDPDQMNFVTDLFASQCDEAFDVDDLGVSFGVLDGAREFGSSHEEDDLELELGLGFDSVAQLSELSVPQGLNSAMGAQRLSSTMGGLRVVGLESDSDSEGFVRDDDPFGDPAVTPFWDGTGFEDQRGEGEELEWEEVEEQRVYERDGLTSVIDQIEELSVSSEISNIQVEEEAGEGNIDEVERSLEWEFLLAVNNLERSLELESDSFGEYDELFGQLMQNEYVSKGSPPTAKSVVENLPIVVLTEEELQGNDMVCAVCKDDISMQDKVTKLPCCHHYHGDCIVPWLSIRNTCPVCRYELPTDDADYERRRTHGTGLPMDVQVRYNFEPLL